MIGSVLPGQPRAGHDVLYSFMKPIDRQVGSVRPVGNQGEKKNSQMSWPCRRRRRSTECWIHWRASIGFYDSKFPYKRSTSLDGCSLFLFLSLSLSFWLLRSDWRLALSSLLISSTATGLAYTLRKWPRPCPNLGTTLKMCTALA